VTIMKTLHILAFILDTIWFTVSLVRVCIGIGQVQDYIILLFTAGIVADGISKMITMHKQRKKKDNNDV